MIQNSAALGTHEIVKELLKSVLAWEWEVSGGCCGCCQLQAVTLGIALCCKLCWEPQLCWHPRHPCYQTAWRWLCLYCYGASSVPLCVTQLSHWLMEPGHSSWGLAGKKHPVFSLERAGASAGRGGWRLRLSWGALKCSLCLSRSASCGLILSCSAGLVSWSQPCHRRVVNLGCPAMCLCQSWYGGTESKRFCVSRAGKRSACLSGWGLYAPITHKNELTGEHLKSAFAIFFSEFPLLPAQRLEVLVVDCPCAFSGTNLQTLPSGTSNNDNPNDPNNHHWAVCAFWNLLALLWELFGV